MASSDPEIKDGFNLPVWMKNKQSKDFDAFAGSPPAPEDSFFYIRYPKTDVLFGKNKGQEIPKILSELPTEVRTAAAFTATKETDWSKHTKPCQDVLHGIAPINTAASSASAKPKPAGVDDGFKGEGAACGSSVVKVAHQMISSSGRGRGFRVALPEDEEAQHYDLLARRGSRSLPVTPAHSPPASPTGRRRMNGNRFFTSPFEPVSDAHSRSWLTMALLGFKKDITASTSTLAEEDALETRLQVGTLAESVESLGPAPKDLKVISNEPSPVQPKPPKPAQAFRAKPSELREMNFWSPTSM